MPSSLRHPSASSQQGIALSAASFEPWRSTTPQCTLFERGQTAAVGRAAILPPLDTEGTLKGLPTMPAVDARRVQTPLVLGLVSARSIIASHPLRNLLRGSLLMQRERRQVRLGGRRHLHQPREWSAAGSRRSRQARWTPPAPVHQC